MLANTAKWEPSPNETLNREVMIVRGYGAGWGV
jgi:hypothetical protein